MGGTVLCLWSVGLCEPGRTLIPDLKHIICLDLLPKLFKSPHVISHNKLLYQYTNQIPIIFNISHHSTIHIGMILIRIKINF